MIERMVEEDSPKRQQNHGSLIGLRNALTASMPAKASKLIVGVRTLILHLYLPDGLDYEHIT
jgi:hypothetical protein